MFKIGCHLSITKGYYAMGANAIKINANTFQFFTRSPRGGSAKSIDPSDSKRLEKLMDDNNFAPILAHASYLLNVASPKPDLRKYSMDIMKDDLARLDQLPCYLYNFHPGNYSGEDLKTGINKISEALNKIIEPDQKTIILLETMSGRPTEIGKTFEELKEIIDGVSIKDKIGVCLDTCHVFDAGYDIVNNLDGVLTKFDKTIGLKRLHAIHLNDSKNPLGSHKDRHEKIGEGYIGIEAFKRIINHSELKDLPFLLETPNEIEGYEKEIQMLRDFYKNQIIDE